MRRRREQQPEQPVRRRGLQQVPVRRERREPVQQLPVQAQRRGLRQAFRRRAQVLRPELRQVPRRSQ